MKNAKKSALRTVLELLAVTAFICAMLFLTMRGTGTGAVLLFKLKFESPPGSIGQPLYPEDGKVIACEETIGTFAREKGPNKNNIAGLNVIIKSEYASLAKEGSVWGMDKDWNLHLIDSGSGTKLSHGSTISKINNATLLTSPLEMTPLCNQIR